MTSSDDFASLLERHTKELELVELLVRESLGGFQAIAKYRAAITGPWGVGCDPVAHVAMFKALIAGEQELKHGRDGWATEWTPEMSKVGAYTQQITDASTAEQPTDDFDDILG
jgi:hypothetical protein